jgi:hypothetical protein
MEAPVKPFKPPLSRSALLLILAFLLCVGIVWFLLVYFALRGNSDTGPMRKTQDAPYFISNLKKPREKLGAFYTFSRSGYMSLDELWFIDVQPDVIDAFIAQYKLQPTATIPPEFWKLPPTDWPRQLPPDAIVMQSPGFTPDKMKPEGGFFFLIYDKANCRAYIWYRSV